MEKTYKNISGAPNLGFAVGEVFTAELSEAQEKRMIARHSIEVVDPSKLVVTEVEEGEEFSEAGAPVDPKPPEGDGTSGDGKDNPDGKGEGVKTPDPKPPFGKKGS